jgi:hypothetical protein
MITNYQNIFELKQFGHFWAKFEAKLWQNLIQKVVIIANAVSHWSNHSHKNYRLWLIL